MTNLRGEGRDEDFDLRIKILDTVTDCVTGLLYYDRKEDDELPVGAIEDAIRDGVVTVDEIVAKFRAQFPR